METPAPQEQTKEEKVEELKRLIAENARDLETMSGQDAINAQRAIEVYEADLKNLENEEQGN